MSFALQQTTQTISSLSFAFPDLPIGPGEKKDDSAKADAPKDVLSAAAKTAEKAAVVIDALQEAVDFLRRSDKEKLRGVAEYQRLGRAQEARAEKPETTDAPRKGNLIEANRLRISETTISGEGFSASLVRAQSISVGPEGRTAESSAFGEISLEIDGFDIEISFNQVVQFDEKTGFASAERFGEISISGKGFEATLGFEQTLELGPDGPSASSGRFAEYSLKSDGVEAQFAFEKVAGFDPAGIFVSSAAQTTAVAKTEGGVAAVEIFRQLTAYLHRDEDKPGQTTRAIG